MNHKRLAKKLRKRLTHLNFGKSAKFIPLLALLIIVGITYAASSKTVLVTPELLNTYASKIVEICRTEAYRPACYDREIPKLTDKISMEQAFKVTSIVQKKDPSYTYCHVLGHELSAIEVKRDPENWKDVVSRCPSGLCSNGCIHGGFQERFRAETFTDQQIEDVLPDLKTICEDRPSWHPTGLEQGSCYHAVGHLTMYLTGADADKSIKLCDQAAKKSDGRDFVPVCYDGVFMQIFQPLEPEDFALVKGKEQTKDTVTSFCNRFEETPKSNCWNEAWPLFRDDILTPGGLVRHCSKLTGGHEDRCYNALFFVVTAQFNLDTKKMLSFCPGLPESRVGSCFGNAAARMIEVDYRNISKAVDFCAQAKSSDPEEGCYRELIKYSTFNFHTGSTQFYELCNSLPEAWKKQCLEGADGKKIS